MSTKNKAKIRVKLVNETKTKKEVSGEFGGRCFIQNKSYKKLVVTNKDDIFYNGIVDKGIFDKNVKKELPGRRIEKLLDNIQSVDSSYYINLEAQANINHNFLFNMQKINVTWENENCVAIDFKVVEYDSVFLNERKRVFFSKEEFKTNVKKIDGDWYVNGVILIEQMYKKIKGMLKRSKEKGVSFKLNCDKVIINENTQAIKEEFKDSIISLSV